MSWVESATRFKMMQGRVWNLTQVPGVLQACSSSTASPAQLASSSPHYSFNKSKHAVAYEPQRTPRAPTDSHPTPPLPASQLTAESCL